VDRATSPACVADADRIVSGADGPGLVAAVREFHWLRLRQERGERTTAEEAGRIRLLLDVLEPRRPGAAARTRLEIPLSEPAVVTSRGRSMGARLTWLALRRVGLEVDPPLLAGERVLLSIGDGRAGSCHFHCRVLRSRGAAAVLELLAVSWEG
jgi:hypothetical protein